MNSFTLYDIGRLLIQLHSQGYELLRPYSVLQKDGQFGPGSYEISLVATPLSAAEKLQWHKAKERVSFRLALACYGFIAVMLVVALLASWLHQ